MSRRLTLAAAIVFALAIPGAAIAAPPQFTAGAAGIGDPYFPLDGNGGYEVQHYDLKLTYNPATDVLTGEATITAKALQNLSTFDLDYVGPKLKSLMVNGSTAGALRQGQELVVRPQHGLTSGSSFTVVARYEGVPQTLDDGSGFIHTADGAIAIGEPHGASSWFPANDHPRDKATFTFHITAPAGLEVLSNGIRTGQQTAGGWTTTNWDAVSPMATYLAFIAIGEFAVRSWQSGGIRYTDAIDSQYFDDIAPAVTPFAGAQLLNSQMGDMSFKRLTRTISVPPGGAPLSFQVNRDTEPGWDFLFVESRTAGGNDWTTLPDANGHTSQDVGNCPYTYWDLHPFMEHYVTPYLADAGDPSTPDDDFYSCSPTGTSGAWNAASGQSNGWESWSVQLPNATGTTRSVEVSISYASDWSVQLRGVALDQIVGPSGQGTTGFENDGNVMDGWVAPIPGPDGSPDNPNTWVVATLVPAIPGDGPRMTGTFDRLPDILDFESNLFGAYPYTAAGGVIDDSGVGFALENQTRPTYSPVFWFFNDDPTWVLAHENAHQWFGDLVSVDSWQYTWLNEGFATYVQWLWNEHEGTDVSPEAIFEDGTTIPADDPFWELAIGDPGIDCLFCGEIYFRGAMTLQALRNEVGSTKFFKILRTWLTTHAYSTGTTRQFIDVAESIAKKDLDPLFAQWLGSGKPTIGIPSGPGPHAAPTLRNMPLAIRELASQVRDWKTDRFRDPKLSR